MKNQVLPRMLAAGILVAGLLTYGYLNKPETPQSNKAPTEQKERPAKVETPSTPLLEFERIDVAEISPRKERPLAFERLSVRPTVQTNYQSMAVPDCTTPRKVPLAPPSESKASPPVPTQTVAYVDCYNSQCTVRQAQPTYNYQAEPQVYYYQAQPQAYASNCSGSSYYYPQSAYYRPTYSYGGYSPVYYRGYTGGRGISYVANSYGPFGLFGSSYSYRAGW